MTRKQPPPLTPKKPTRSQWKNSNGKKVKKRGDDHDEENQHPNIGELSSNFFQSKIVDQNQNKANPSTQGINFPESNNTQPKTYDRLPLQSTRDPLRRRGQRTMLIGPTDRDQSKKKNRKNTVKPAYAFKNAETGLLEISTDVPPSPSIISKSNKAPSLFPIALNGGGCGVYNDPRSFAMSAATTSHSRNNPMNMNPLVDNHKVQPSHISFPWNSLSLKKPKDIEKKDSNSQRSEIDNHVRIRMVENDSFDSNETYGANNLEFSTDQTQVADQEAAEIISSLRRGKIKKERIENGFENEETDHQELSMIPTTPWRIWEQVHNCMVRVAESRQEVQQQKQFMKYCTNEDFEKTPPPLSIKQKAARLSSIYNRDGFDFVLVLHRKRVYSFWADLLDFRAENGILQPPMLEDEDDLGDKLNKSYNEEKNVGKLERGSFDHPIDHAPFPLSASRNGNQNSNMSSSFTARYEKEDTINSPDTDEWSCDDIYQTPSRGSRKRSLRNKYNTGERHIEDESHLNTGNMSIDIEQEENLRRSSRRRRRTITKKKRSPRRSSLELVQNSDLLVFKGEASIDDKGQRVFWKNQSLFERAMSTITPPKQTGKQLNDRQNKLTRSKSPLQSHLSPLGNSSRKIVKAIRTSLHNATSPLRNKSYRNVNDNGADESDMNLSNSAQTHTRRRWGSVAASAAYGQQKLSTPNLFSPPIHSLKNDENQLLDSNKRKTKRQKTVKSRIEYDSDGNRTPPRPEKKKNSPKSRKKRKKRRNPNSLIAEEIPTQLVPRGIFKRTNGMEEFLSALKRGFVVRRHRPNAESAFVKIISSDGGDTIKFSYVPYEHAMIALKEQEIRYNRKRRNSQASKAENTTKSKMTIKSTPICQEKGDPNCSRLGEENDNVLSKNSNSTSRVSSDSFENSITSNQDSRKLQFMSEKEQIKKFVMPDFIAAEKYRMEQSRNSGGLRKSLSEMVTRVAHSGIVKASEIIAVHPAVHPDKYSLDGEFGSCTLRDSPTDYDENRTFSLVMPSPSMMFTSGTNWVNSIGNGSYSASAIKSATERWCEGVGSEKSFRYLDLEAATEGEYWMIFRGFLLLHRDATFGRFAAQRASGFGSNYNRKELEERNQLMRSNSQSKGTLFGKQNRGIQFENRVFSEPEETTWLYRSLSSMLVTLSEWRNRKEKNADTNCKTRKKTNPPPSDYFLGFKSTGTQIWSRLRQAGLETQRIYALDKNRVMIKLRCSQDRLMDVAEVLRVKLKTKDGYYAPFRESMISNFLPSNDVFGSNESPEPDGGSLFRSSERQLIIDFIIRSRIRDSGAELGQNTDLGKDIELRVPLHMYAGLELLYHGWVWFWKKDNWNERNGLSMSVAPEKQTHFFSRSLGTKSEDTKLKGSRSWIYRFFVGSLFQPLDSIEQYFGERVAFYFAWMQHCSYHLIFISLAGLALFLCQVCTGRFDHPIRPYFASIVMIWSFLVMVSWRKRQRFLAHRWGTLNYKEEETTRPQFHGIYKQCEITSEWIVYYPSWKRWLKYMISLPLTAAFTVATGIGILIIYANRDIVLARYFGDRPDNNEVLFSIDWSINAIGKKEPIESIGLTKEQLTDPYFWFIIAGFPSILGLALPLLNFLLMKVSLALNEFENYQTESHYRNHLIVKIFTFRFVSNFATLYYYAYMSIGTDKRRVENGILRVGTSLFIYITVAHWWHIFLSIYLPMYIHRWKMHRQKKNLREEHRKIENMKIQAENDNNLTRKQRQELEKRLTNHRILLEQAESNVWEEMMLPEHDPFLDYIQGVIQFAYVACFSAVLPLTPLIVLINNLFSMRLNAYKICRGRRRPLAEKTGGIGVWEHALHVVTVIAVFTNCSLMALTSSQFHIVRENWGSLGIFGTIVCWEHMMLMIKYAMQSLFSKNPKSVDDSLKKEQFENTQKRNFTMRAKKERRSGSYPKPDTIKKSESSLSTLLESDYEKEMSSDRSGRSKIEISKKVNKGSTKIPKSNKQDGKNNQTRPKTNIPPQMTPKRTAKAPKSHNQTDTDSCKGTSLRPSTNFSNNVMKKVNSYNSRISSSSFSACTGDFRSSKQGSSRTSSSSYETFDLGENNVKKRIQNYNLRFSHGSNF